MRRHFLRRAKMRGRLLVIHNPKAGLHHGRYEAVLSYLRKAGAVAEIVEPHSANDSRLVALSAAKRGTFGAVIAAGGDGTVHDVAAGLLGRARSSLCGIPMALWQEMDGACAGGVGRLRRRAEHNSKTHLRPAAAEYPGCSTRIQRQLSKRSRGTFGSCVFDDRNHSHRAGCRAGS